VAKKPKLTAKQAKFVQGIAEGKSGTQAALDAYDTTDPNTAALISSENIRKPNVKEALEPILEKHRINLDRAIEPISAALDADKQDVSTGEWLPDHKTRLQASDRALKLMGIGQDKTPTINNFGNLLMQQKSKYDE
jgi:phage terminase small subunit